MSATMSYLAAAEAVWFIHAVYVFFVVGGQIAILAGAMVNWLWVRHLWFRVAHVAAIGIVAFETIIDVPCTLTVLQDYLLVQGGMRPRGFNINPFAVPRGFWDETYLVFAAVVLLTFVLVPPRMRRRAGAGTVQASRELA
jgi:hypothetical protein